MKLVGCATVVEELLPLMPPEMPRQVLDFGLHLRPGGLTLALQAAIDASPDADAILLGYGLCSRAVLGLRATHGMLVIPRVDDCIALHLGSRSSREAEARREPGTYYVTKGWVEAGDMPCDEADRLAARFGPGRAERIVARMLAGYTRLAYIATGGDEGRHRDRARACAERFGLRFDVVAGSPALVRRLLSGPWDDEFVVVPAGGTVGFEAFVRGRPERRRARPAPAGSPIRVGAPDAG